MWVCYRLPHLLQLGVEDTLQVDVECQCRQSSVTLDKVHYSVFASLVLGGNLRCQSRSAAEGRLLALPLIDWDAVLVGRCKRKGANVLRILQRLVVYRHVRIMLLVDCIVFFPLVQVMLAIVLDAEIRLPWLVARLARDELLSPVHRLPLGLPKAHDVG